MTIGELGKICKEKDIDCDNCEHQRYCFEVLPYELEDATPCMLLTILDTEVRKP